MKKNILCLLALLLSVALLAGCASSGQNAGSTDNAENATQVDTAAQTEATELSEELIRLSTFRLDENEMVLPVSYAEFSEKTGFTFSNNLIGTFTEETRLPAYTTLNLNYRIGDGYFYILVANQSEKEIAAKDGEVIAVKVSRFRKEDNVPPFDYCGIGWESSKDDIQKLLGEAENAETNKQYHMLGYSKKRDGASNISYSFITDSDVLYSFALSIDNMAITYSALETETEAETGK